MPNIHVPPRLETPRLVLRGHVIDDFDASAAMWADPNVVRYISGTPCSREEAWSRFLRYLGHWSLLGFGYWVVEDKDTGVFIGEAGFADYQREMEPSLGGRPEAGWVLKSSAHGQGFATEVVHRMITWADEFLEHRKTVCIFNPDHDVSIRVARKVGYIEIGTASYRG